MHENYSDNVNTLKTTRRVMLKAATAATLGAVLEPLAEGQPSAPLDYGKGAGQAHLDSTNVFHFLPRGCSSQPMALRILWTKRP